jgi:hypothetical protein
LEVLELDRITMRETPQASGQDAEWLHYFPNLRRFGGTYPDLVARMRSVGRSARDELAPADAFYLPRSLRDVGAWKLGDSAQTGTVDSDALLGLANAGADTIEGALVLPSPCVDAVRLMRILPLFKRVRRLSLQELNTDDDDSRRLRTTDVCIAALLRHMPALTALELGSVAGTVSGLTFVGAAYDGVCAPGLRELVVARVRSLGDDGIATIVRVCPNLRALDIRGCLSVTTDGFAAAVLEAPCAGLAPKQQHALRLRKLRRVVASLNWPPPPPRALDFIQYHPGLSGREERNYVLSGQAR